MAKEFFRYNPSKEDPNRPWQVKRGKTGRPKRQRTVNINSSLKDVLRGLPGEWFVDVEGKLASGVRRGLRKLRGK